VRPVAVEEEEAEMFGMYSGEETREGGGQEGGGGRKRPA